MSTTEEEVTRVALTAKEAHLLTNSVNFMSQLRETLESGQMDMNHQIGVILKRAGVKETDKPWGMEIDGDNVVIRRQ